MPLQSAGWQMVRLSTCNWNTVCRFALFVCWTQWNRRHLLAISHFCSTLQAHFFKLHGRCWFGRGSLSLRRFGFAQTCCVCSLRWGVLPSPFSSLFQKKVSMPGCSWIREWVQGRAVLFRHLMVWEWIVTFSQWGPAGWLGGNQSWGGGWDPTHFIDCQMTHSARTMPACFATPPFTLCVFYRKSLALKS